MNLGDEESVARSSPTPDYPTSTAQWSLVIHRVSQRSVEVWVGTLFPALKKPEHARVRLFHGGRAVRTRRIRRQDWKRPFAGLTQRFFTVVTFRSLEAGTAYDLAFERRIEANPRAGIERRWQRLRSGTFGTLPGRLPEKGLDAFTIGLGSCFYNHRDGGRAAAAYQALYERGRPTVRPDVTMLVGDQVYLDIGFDSLSLIPQEIRERIANDYALHWQALGSMLSRGGTWMLPDDHEYWNDYPFVDALLPTLWALNVGSVRKHWTNAASDGVRNVQCSPMVETFTLGEDLSVCLADLRSHRSEQELLPQGAFHTLLDWARHRACPGVLVISQPLIVEPDRFERNLRSYESSYARLLEALGSASHDVVVLSGDVHFGRIASVPIGTRGARLIEIVSSPMSNLTGLLGSLATSVATDRPTRFPPNPTAEVLGWQPRRVKYDPNGRGRFFVQSQKGRWRSAYPRARTCEHVMTVSFCRLPRDRGIEMTAQAWLLRQRTKVGNMPVKSFTRPFKTILT